MLKMFPILSLLPLAFGCVVHKIERIELNEGRATIVRDSINHMPQIIVWSDFALYSQGVKDWMTVASQRFNNPVLFFCHGGVKSVETTLPNGMRLAKNEWWVFPDHPRKPVSANEVARTLAQMYPDRDIVFMSCNPGGFELNVPRVWYTKKNNWVVPDPFAIGNVFGHERRRDFDAVGSIWEFVSYDGRDLQPATQPTTQPTTAPTTQPSTRPVTVAGTVEYRGAGWQSPQIR
jgi:hypothetical protein